MYDKTVRFRRVFAVALMFFIFAVLWIDAVDAHNKQVSQKDLCHNKAGELHWHPDESDMTIEAPCVRNKNWTIKYHEIEVERIKEKEVVREVKSVNVQNFEQAMNDVIDRLEYSIDKPPKVVKVKERVPWLRPTNEHCEELRDEFVKKTKRMFGRGAKDIALQAVDDGCW